MLGREVAVGRTWGPAREFPSALLKATEQIIQETLAFWIDGGEKLLPSREGTQMAKERIPTTGVQLQLNAAPLPGRQTAEGGTAVAQVCVGTEPRRQHARQGRRQLRGSTQQGEARQGRVEGKRGRVQRYSLHASHRRCSIHRDHDRSFLHGPGAVLPIDVTAASAGRPVTSLSWAA